MSIAMTGRAFEIRGVLFDFDGTLTGPGAHQWQGLREKIGCPPGTGVLEFIEAIADAEQRRSTDAELVAFEEMAAARSTPAEGAVSLVQALRRRNLPVGILTRNSRRSVETALARFDGLCVADFDPVITRETPVTPKPAPEGVHYAARRWGIDAEQVLVVGDYVYDIESGRRAGAVTVLLATSERPGMASAAPDFRIRSLSQVLDVVRLGTPIGGGKLPNDLLAAFFDEYPTADPDLLIPPGVGQDTAAVALGGDQVLVLKSDPITFVTDAVAEYAVVVNANDVATSGATPRWLLTTLLFAPGSTPSQIRRVMADLQEVCRRRGIALCGGHTEITDAVTRPVVTGMLCGVVRKDRIIDKRNMRAGDRIVMTKRVAVEGTAIIAREFKDRLIRAGVSEQTVAAAAGFLSDISILKEARIAADAEGPPDGPDSGVRRNRRHLPGGRHRPDGVDRFRNASDRLPAEPRRTAACRYSQRRHRGDHHRGGPGTAPGHRIGRRRRTDDLAGFRSGRADPAFLKHRAAVLGQLSDRLNFLCCTKKMRRSCGREQRTIDHVLALFFSISFGFRHQWERVRAAPSSCPFRAIIDPEN